MLVNTIESAAPAVLETQEAGALRQTFETNTFGPLTVVQAFLPFIRETGARIVFITSLCAQLTPPLFGGLCASKAALECASFLVSVSLGPRLRTVLLPPSRRNHYHPDSRLNPATAACPCLTTTALADALRRELAPYAVSVSSIEPAVATPDSASLAAAKAQAGDVYAHLFAGDKAQALLSSAGRDYDPATMRALIHSVSSPHPKVRYPAGRIGHLPANMVAALSWLLPLRLQDSLLA